MWSFTVEGWTDAFATWRGELRKKVDAGQDVGLELQEGALLVRAAARRAKSPAVRASMLETSRAMTTDKGSRQTHERALGDELASLMSELYLPRDVTRYSRELPLERMARDVRMFTIGGGTAEVLRNVVAGALLKKKLPQTRDGWGKA